VAENDDEKPAQLAAVCGGCELYLPYDRGEASVRLRLPAA